ncbi:hypothetical protein Tco_0642639 [Tanacetum coccineum]
MRTRSQARISVPEPPVRQPSVESSNLEKPDNPPIVTMADIVQWPLLEAPTEGYEDAIQKFDETFYEAWDRFNDLLRGCPHHGFSELHQLDTFYNALNSNDQDSLNSAAGASTSGSGTLPGNTVTNPKEDLKGITTRSGATPLQGTKSSQIQDIEGDKGHDASC